MRQLALAVAACLALSACSGKDDGPEFPAVEGHWSVAAGNVVCDGPTGLAVTPSGPGPYTRIECTWHRVSYQRQDRCWVRVTYARYTTADAWSDPLVESQVGGSECPP